MKTVILRNKKSCDYYWNPQGKTWIPVMESKDGYPKPIECTAQDFVEAKKHKKENEWVGAVIWVRMQEVDGVWYDEIKAKRIRNLNRKFELRECWAVYSVNRKRFFTLEGYQSEDENAKRDSIGDWATGLNTVGYWVKSNDYFSTFPRESDAKMCVSLRLRCFINEHLEFVKLNKVEEIKQ